MIILCQAIVFVPVRRGGPPFIVNALMTKLDGDRMFFHGRDNISYFIPGPGLPRRRPLWAIFTHPPPSPHIIPNCSWKSITLHLGLPYSQPRISHFHGRKFYDPINFRSARIYYQRDQSYILCLSSTLPIVIPSPYIYPEKFRATASWFPSIKTP